MGTLRLGSIIGVIIIALVIIMIFIIDPNYNQWESIKTFFCRPLAEVKFFELLVSIVAITAFFSK